MLGFIKKSLSIIFLFNLVLNGSISFANNDIAVSDKTFVSENLKLIEFSENENIGGSFNRNASDSCNEKEIKSFSNLSIMNSLNISNSEEKETLSKGACINLKRINKSIKENNYDVDISDDDIVKITLLSMIHNVRKNSDFAVILSKDIYKKIKYMDFDVNMNFGTVKISEDDIFRFNPLSLESYGDVLISGGDATNNTIDDKEACSNSMFRNFVLSDSTGISDSPVGISTISVKSGEKFEDKMSSLKNQYPALREEFIAIEKEHRYFTIKEMKNLFGNTIGILVLDPKEKIKTTSLDALKSGMVSVYFSTLKNPEKKRRINGWSDSACPISFNELELRRNAMAECSLCKYLYILNNSFMNTAELFFLFLKTSMLGFLVILFSLWIVLKFYDSIKVPDKFDPKSYVTGMFRKPIRIAFFLGIIFASPRFLANTFFYPIIMIGTSSMQLTIDGLEKAEESFMSKDEKSFVSTKRFCEPEEDFRNFLRDQKRDADKFAEKENVKLFPKSKEILSRGDGFDSSGGNSYQYIAENTNDIGSIKVNDGEFYIAQMSCGVKSIKKMFATNRVIGELMIEDAINKFDINIVNLGILAMAKINPLVGLASDATKMKISNIISITGGVSLTSLLLEAFLGLTLILINLLIVLYIFFTFFEIMIEIAFKIILLPIGAIFFCFGKDTHKEMISAMKDFALEFFTIALRMCFIFLIYRASISFILDINSVEISKAFVYGSKSYILNSIDISHLSFADLLFIIVINLYIISNVNIFVETSIGSIREGYQGAAQAFTEKAGKKILGAKKTAYKAGKKYFSKK